MPLKFYEVDHSSIPDITVDEFLSKCLLVDKGYEYRGQGDKSWGLVPSIFRTGGTAVDLVERTRRLKYFYEDPHQQSQFDVDFKRLLNLAGPSEQVTPSDRPGYEKLLRLAFFQHFGIPTPLLDWTSSPLVALFMALYERPPTATDISIFRYDPTLLPQDVTFQQYNRISFRRIQSQMGGVMFFGTCSADQIMIEPHIYSEYINASKPQRFIQKLNITITPTDIEKIHNALRNNGFREDMLFPNSMQFVARQIRERMLL